MTAQGFVYELPPAAPGVPVPDTPYGIDDVAWAQQHGYGLAAQAEAADAQRDSPNARYVSGLPPSRQAAYDAALFGTDGRRITATLPSGQTVAQSSDGCLARAQGELYGDFAHWFRVSTVTDNLEPAIQPRVFGDVRYQQALAAWSACVGGAGHPATSPDARRAQLADGGGAIERELAVTDATCNRQVRLATVGRQLDEELGAPVRARFRHETDAVASMRFDALVRSAAVIGSTS